MVKEEYNDGDWLYQKYYQEHLTQSEMAEIADCSQKTISNWLKEHDIEARNTGPQRFPHASFGMHHGYERSKGDVRNGEEVRIHRLAAVAWFGLGEVKGKEIHHKNNIPWDNRKENLEPLTKEEHNTVHHACKEINEAQLEGLKIGWYMDGHNAD